MIHLKRLRCWLFGHRFDATPWHDEGTPLDVCMRCDYVDSR